MNIERFSLKEIFSWVFYCFFFAVVISLEPLMHIAAEESASVALSVVRYIGIIDVILLIILFLSSRLGKIIFSLTLSFYLVFNLYSVRLLFYEYFIGLNPIFQYFYFALSVIGLFYLFKGLIKNG